MDQLNGTINLEINIYMVYIYWYGKNQKET